MRDLELRGAGNLLGDEQSGMSPRSASSSTASCWPRPSAELQGTALPPPRPVRVDAHVDAYVPADYVPLEAVKVDLHRRVALAADRGELRELLAELTDRFGPPPPPVENLLGIQEARLIAAELGADTVTLRGGPPDDRPGGARSAQRAGASRALPERRSIPSPHVEVSCRLPTPPPAKEKPTVACRGWKCSML